MPRPKTPREPKAKAPSTRKGGYNSMSPVMGKDGKLMLRNHTNGGDYPELDVVLSYATFGISMARVFSLFRDSAAIDTDYVLNLTRPLNTQLPSLENLIIADLDRVTDNSTLANAAAYAIGAYKAATRAAAKGSKSLGISPYSYSNHNMQKWLNYNEPFYYWWGAIDEAFSQKEDDLDAYWVRPTNPYMQHVGAYIGAVPSIERVLYSATDGIPKYSKGGASIKKGSSGFAREMKYALTNLDL